MNFLKNPDSSRFLTELILELKNFLIYYDEIILAYLYGSLAKGTFNSESDIDIGLYVKPSILDDRWFPIKLKSEVESQIQKIYDRHYKVDIRIINSSNVKFQYNVIFQNPRIIVRDEPFRVKFEKEILIKWYDMRPTWELFYKKREEWLKSGV